MGWPDKPRYFTHYWRNDTVEAHRLASDEGQPCDAVFSKNFSAIGVTAGDYLYEVTVIGGEIYLICRLRVHAVRQRTYPPSPGEADEHTGGYTPAEARRVAETMSPDILPYDPTGKVAYPDNGRTLTDDPADILFAVMTNGWVTEDKAGPHSDLLSKFPYVGPPHAT